MTTTCPQCSKPVRPAARFCPNCRHQLNATSTAGIVTQRLVNGPRLVLREPSGAKRELALPGTPLIIGRDSAAGLPLGLPVPPSDPIGLPDISRRHAQVVPMSSTAYAIMDLGSANGTFLRGQRLAPNQPSPLQDGDVIRIGAGYGNSVSLTYLVASRPIAPSGTVHLGLTQLGSLARLRLGRSPQSEVVLNSPVVSLQHAELVRTAAGHDLIDCGSTNGTFVNGMRISRVALHRGDMFQIGPYKLIYSLAGLQQYAPAGVRLDAVQLRKEVPAPDPSQSLRQAAGEAMEMLLGTRRPRTKVLLRDICFSVYPREFIALVGGSGAGKSTLIDALNGSRRARGGQVLINGEDLYRNFDAYRHNMGYVPQSDILHTGLTVEHALGYTARLRLPADLRPPEVQLRIDQVLQMVDMQAQKSLLISKLSGGQRKRVSIASELLSDPGLLFLDEPTSGLDPGLDKKMMNTLNHLADGGRTVVLTTHATQNIEGACDHVAFLSHGRLVYFGPPHAAKQFFNTSDFATIYGKVESPPQSEQEEQRFKASPDYQQHVIQRQSAPPVPGRAAARPAAANPAATVLLWLRQFVILSVRYVDLIRNDWLSLFVLAAVMPIIGALLLVIANGRSLVGDCERIEICGAIRRVLEAEGYYSIVNDAQKLLFMLALSVILLGIFAAAYEIVKERAVYERERMINLGLLPYLGSKIVVLMGFGFVQCLALLLVVALKVRLPWGGVLFPAVLEMYVSLELAMLASICLGLLISALVKSNSAVIYLILVVLFVQIMFSGALFALPPAAQPISYLTSTRWALEGLGATVDMHALNSLSQSYIRETGQMIEASVDFNINYQSSPLHLFGTWLVQLFFAATYAGLAGLALWRQDVR